eukprot:Colp12_sorted_trinity150504_noHs@34817
MAAKGLGVNAQFAVFPGIAFVSCGDEGDIGASLKLVKADQGYDMGKLQLLDQVCDQLASGPTSVEMSKAIQEIDDIVKSPSYYGPWSRTAALAFSSACIAPLFFKGQWIDAAMAFCLGAIVGLFNMLADRSSSFSKIFEIVSAIFCAAISRLLQKFVLTDLCATEVAVSAIVWLIPGLTITLATTELAFRSTVSGTARMFSSFLLTVMLGFGLAIGDRLVLWNKAPPAGPCPGLDEYWNFLFFFPISLGFNVLLKAQPRQFPAMTGVSAVGLLVSYFTSKIFNPETSTVIAAFAVGIAGNLYARLTSSPAIIPIISGILLQVPGTIGLKGVTAFLNNDVFNGITFGGQVIVISVSITVGVFAANVFVVPRKSSPAITKLKY